MQENSGAKTEKKLSIPSRKHTLDTIRHSKVYLHGCASKQQKKVRNARKRNMCKQILETYEGT